MESFENVKDSTDRGLAKSIQTSVKFINQYVTYTPTGSNITYKDDNGEDVTVAIPSLLQISRLVDNLVCEYKPYQKSNFLAFATNVSFAFDDANLYEIMLISVANLVTGLQEGFSITEEASDSIIDPTNQEIHLFLN